MYSNIQRAMGMNQYGFNGGGYQARENPEYTGPGDRYRADMGPMYGYGQESYNQGSQYRQGVGAHMGGRLSPEQQAENYTLFSKLMDEGVSLSDLMRRAEGPQDMEFFSAMESSVMQDPEIQQARHRLDRIKDEVMMELCQKDPRFKHAMEDYKREVSRKYMAMNGQSQQ